MSVHAVETTRARYSSNPCVWYSMNSRSSTDGSFSAASRTALATPRIKAMSPPMRTCTDMIPVLVVWKVAMLTNSCGTIVRLEAASINGVDVNKLRPAPVRFGEPGNHPGRVRCRSIKSGAFLSEQVPDVLRFQNSDISRANCTTIRSKRSRRGSRRDPTSGRVHPNRIRCRNPRLQPRCRIRRDQTRKR